MEESRKAQDHGSLDPLDDPVHGPRLMAERIRKAEEELNRPRVEHEAAIHRLGRSMTIWFIMMHAFLIATIVVSCAKQNYEIANLACALFCGSWFYAKTRLLDRRWLRGPRTNEKPLSHPDGNG